MATKKRMGGMSLSKLATNKVEPTTPPPSSPPTEEPKPAQKTPAKAKPKAKKSKKEKLSTLNIQVTRKQQRWLQDTAQDIRDNNDAPVAGPDRVYPVHLIQTAVDLLKSQDIEWDKVTDIEGLRSQLNL